MTNRAIIDQFFNAGKNLTILNGKKPIEDNWQNEHLSKDIIYKHKGNIGWVLGDNDFVVDVDPRNGGDASFEKLQKDLDICLNPTVYTAQGGFHVYLTLPSGCEDKKLRKNLKQYVGIDFLTKGHQCVIPSSKTEHGKYSFANEEQEFTQEICPDAIINLLASDNQQTRASKNSELGDFEGLISCASSTWSQEQVEALLAKLDPSTDYDSWLRVGMALKNWDAIEGLALWDKWSQGCTEKYKQGDCDYKWKGFKVDGGVTFGSLVHMAQEVDYYQEAQLVQAYLEKIKLATDPKTLEFDLAHEIRKTNINDINRDKLAEAFKVRIKEFTGTKISIDTIRKMLSRQKSSNVVPYDSELISLFSNLVYASKMCAYINVANLEQLSAKAFDLKFGKFIPFEGSSKPSANKYVADRGLIKVVSATSYMPMIKGSFCFIDDIEYLNTFSMASVPKAAEFISDEGQVVIDRIIAHITLLVGTEENAQILLQWIAHQVQNTGVILGWAPFIQSIQGVGKSFLGEVIRSGLGDQNVGTVAPTQVMDKFNGWATNVAVNILEEMRIVGHNRHTVANALKPLITDKIIQINDKGIKHFRTYNSANYICFSNYKDAIPIDKDDRRWWVVFVNINSLDDFPELVGESANSYFDKLYSGLNEHAPEVRKWLLDYPISEEFKSMKRAPMTHDKLSMIQNEEQNIEGLIEVVDEIEKGDVYYDELVVSSSHLFGGLEMVGKKYSTRQKHAILARLGYSQLPPIKIDGEPLRIWTKKKMTNDEVREYLLKKIKEKPDVLSII